MNIKIKKGWNGKKGSIDRTYWDWTAVTSRLEGVTTKDIKSEEIKEITLVI